MICPMPDILGRFSQSLTLSPNRSFYPFVCSAPSGKLDPSTPGKRRSEAAAKQMENIQFTKRRT